LEQRSQKTKIIKPFNAVIFGGNGDLALRKIYPAFFHRYFDNQINCRGSFRSKRFFKERVC